MLVALCYSVFCFLKLPGRLRLGHHGQNVDEKAQAAGKGWRCEVKLVA